MKNFFICFLLVITLLPDGRSQSLLLSYHQQSLNNQSVIVRSGTPDTLDMTTWLTITNRSTDTALVMAKKVMISQVPDASGSICWAGYCYPPYIDESLYPLEMNPGESVTSCFAHFSQQGNIGVSTVRWTYFLRDNPNDSVCVTINYQIWNAGFEEHSNKGGIFSLPYPNPAGKTINFRSKDPLDRNYTLTIVDCSGRKVSTEIFNAGTSFLSVNTGNLPSGIYHYYLKTDVATAGEGNFMVIQ